MLFLRDRARLFAVRARIRYAGLRIGRLRMHAPVALGDLVEEDLLLRDAHRGLSASSLRPPKKIRSAYAVFVFIGSLSSVLFGYLLVSSRPNSCLRLAAGLSGLGLAVCSPRSQAKITRVK